VNHVQAEPLASCAMKTISGMEIPVSQTAPSDNGPTLCHVHVYLALLIV